MGSLITQGVIGACVGMIHRYCTFGVLIAAMFVSGSAGAQSGPPAAVAPAATGAPRDMALEGAESMIGRALFLRGGHAGNDLAFDTMGHAKGETKLVDWTLAGVNIEKVTRRNAGELELDGVRVAMRYNPDQHIFERHPQKDAKVKIILAVNPEARGLQGALAAVFSVGIDPALQRAMPAYWRHYFSPSMAWPNDELTGQTILPANTPATAGLEFPVAEKKPEPEFTAEARQDRVKGLVQVRLTVGTDGVPRRIAIKQPLGYGLDARVAENLARYRFRPGMKDGKPVAMEMIVNQMFDVYPGPR